MTIKVKRPFGYYDTALGIIGRTGENDTRTIDFDCTEALTEYPDANIICVCLRPGDDEPYTIPLSTNGEHRVLTLASADLEKEGRLTLELRMVDGDKVLKSARFTGTVASSLQGEGDAPGTPVRDTLDRLDAEIKAAQAVVDDIRAKLDAGEFDGAKGDPGSDASVTAENIKTALGYAPVSPTALDEKQDVLTDVDKQTITKAGMTSGAAWTAAEQKAARDRMGIAGFAEMEHITTLVMEEETKSIVVDLGKQCRICRFYYKFPETISTGYTYVEVSNTNTQYYNMSGCAIGNKRYLDYIRIASALKPISLFAATSYIGNESTVQLAYSMPMGYPMDETTGFRYLRFTTYQTKFPKNTTIEVYAV